MNSIVQAAQTGTFGKLTTGPEPQDHQEYGQRWNKRTGAPSTRGESQGVLNGMRESRLY